MLTTGMILHWDNITFELIIQLFSWLTSINEPRHVIFNNVVCASSKASEPLLVA